VCVCLPALASATAGVRLWQKHLCLKRSAPQVCWLLMLNFLQPARSSSSTAGALRYLSAILSAILSAEASGEGGSLWRRWKPWRRWVSRSNKKRKITLCSPCLRGESLIFVFSIFRAFVIISYVFYSLRYALCAFGLTASNIGTKISSASSISSFVTINGGVKASRSDARTKSPLSRASLPISMGTFCSIGKGV
jgi:hypothetical protein